MRRRLLNVLTALSLLLCVAACALWPCSYRTRRSPLLDLPRPTALYRFGGWNTAGRIGFGLDRWSWATPAPPRPVELAWAESRPEPSRSWLFARRPRGDGVQVLGVDVYYHTVYRGPRAVGGREYGSYVYGGVVAPHAYWVALLLAMPFVRLRGLAQRRRARKGNRCPRCGYDLRATPDRCPECGASRP